MNRHSIVAWMSRNPLLKTGAISKVYVTAVGLKPFIKLKLKPVQWVLKWTLNHLAKLAKWLNCVVSSYLYGAFDCMFLSCHVANYMFQSEYTLYSCLNVKELLSRNRRHIWSLSGCNRTQTHNHLVHQRTLNHLAKLVKWLSCVVSTYL